MSEFWQSLQSWSSLLFIRAADFIIVSYLAYRLLLLARGSRALQILIGFGLFIGALLFSEWTGMKTLHWLLDKATTMGPVALVILLYPELRQALEHFGRLQFLRQTIGSLGEEQRNQFIEELVKASFELAKSRVGAIMVIERITHLEPVIENGVPVNAPVSAALLNTIFYPGGPLHDGAVIIRGTDIIAAACRLPMSESKIDPSVHMRHRAAVGVSEESDAFVIVVSEERGQVSVVAEGELRKHINADHLRTLLREIYTSPSAPLTPLLKFRKKVDKLVTKSNDRTDSDA